MKQLHDLIHPLTFCMAVHGPTRSFAKKTYPYIIYPSISSHPSSFISTPLPSLPIFSYPPSLSHYPSFMLSTSSTSIYTHSTSPSFPSFHYSTNFLHCFPHLHSRSCSPHTYLSGSTFTGSRQARPSLRLKMGFKKVIRRTWFKKGPKAR